MSKLRFFNIFFLKPGLTKTFYLMKDFQFSLEGAVCFMLENFKKKFMIWVVSVLHFVPYLVGFVWSWAFQKCPKIECSSTFKLASRLSSCVHINSFHPWPNHVIQHSGFIIAIEKFALSAFQIRFQIIHWLLQGSYGL